MRDVGDTDLIDVVKRLVRGSATLAELEQCVDARPSVVNLQNAKGLTPLLVLAQADPFVDRAAAIRLLVQRGANPYLTTSDTGDNMMDAAKEGVSREEVVAALLGHRLEHEPKIKSIAPLSASRLMKRTGDDTGTGVFSNVAKHCLYFSYKGAIFLWDVETDVEHTIFQPRDHHASWSRLDGQLGQFERKRSFVSHGGVDTTFDPAVGEHIAKQMRQVEQQIPLVTNFSLVSGLEAQKDPLPERGVSEWILCNTGALIEVRVDHRGPRLRSGHQSGGRRKSQVCGGTAEYPEGMQPHVNVHAAGAIRFTRRTDAGQVCCAADGLYGTIAYVVASKSAAKQVSATPTITAVSKSFGRVSPAARTPAVATVLSLTHSDERTTSPDAGGSGGGSGVLSPMSQASADERRTPISPPARYNSNMAARDMFAAVPNDDAPSFRDAFSRGSKGGAAGDAGGGIGRGAVSFFRGESPQASSTSPVKEEETPLYVTPADGIVFRVLQFKHMSPKDGFDHSIKSLGAKYDPFVECEVSELRGPMLEGSGDALMVLQCRTEFFVLVTQKKLFVADVNPKRRHSKSPCAFRAQFVELTHVSCGGGAASQFTHAAALAPQRFRTIKPSQQQFFLVTVSTEALSVYEMHEDRSTVCTLKMYPDRVQPHRLTPVFHPTENQLVVFYQSLTRQEVCTFDLVTRRMQSMCKLPKPSSLRFYTQPAADASKQRKKVRRQGAVDGGGGADEPSVPQSNFALSTNGNHLLRYNVTMHVMSVYSWEEIRVRADAMPYTNVSLVREPLPPPPDPREAARLAAKLREPLTKGSACVWIVAESLDLQRFQQDRGMTKASTAVEEGTVNPDEQARNDCEYVDSFAKQVQEVFQRVAASFGGRVVPYEPARFFFVPPPDEVYEEEELLQMEADYFGRMPRHHGIWAASVVAPLEAVQCAIKMVREYLRAPWSAQILEESKYAPVKLEYVPRDAVEKRFPSVPDPEATVWRNRGPRLRYCITGGETTSLTYTLHERMTALVTEDTDGVIVIDPVLQKVLKPLASFFAAKPVPHTSIGGSMVVVPPELSEWLL